VVLGFAITTAIVTGALIVGDSVRGSLRDLALERLGLIDHGLVADRFFRSTIASDLTRETNFRVVSAILLRGSASVPETGLRATKIQVCGADSSFARIFPRGSDYLLELFGDVQNAPTRYPFPPVVINAALQRQLDVEIGDIVLLAVGGNPDVAPEFVFGSRAPHTRLLRAVLTGVLPDRGIGRFGLLAQQSQPYNAFVRLEDLQRTVDRRGEVNALLATATDGDVADSVTMLQTRLDALVNLKDLGLLLSPKEGFLALESREFMIPAKLAAAARAAAAEIGAPALPILTYLAVTIEARDRIVPYSTITAVDPPSPESGFQSLYLEDGSIVSNLADDGILLNSWAANDLGVEPGERITVSYFVPGPGDQLDTVTKDFTLQGIVAPRDLAIRRILTPPFPGLSEHHNMASWEAPFPLNTRSIRPVDEEYWDVYQATPKAFIAGATGHNLWRSRFGELTSVWIGSRGAAGLDVTDQRFEEALLSRLDGGDAGLSFQPLRKQGLEAASGATDFGGLFVGFSIFLIVSAMLLAVLLFGLGMEKRAPEVGYLRALGFSAGAVGRRFKLEGGLLALAGGALGLVMAVAYAWSMLQGLRTWWVAAVGTPYLTVHLVPSTIAIGFAISVSLALLIVTVAVRRLGTMPLTALLQGITTAASRSRSPKKAVFLPLVFLLTGVATAVAGTTMEGVQGAGMFYATGILVLMAALAALRAWLQGGVRPGSGVGGGRLSLVRMGMRNNHRRPGRALLCMALVSAASFILVAVGANRATHPSTEELERLSGGAGGFTLVAESDVPLLRDLDSELGRYELGFNPAAEEHLQETTVLSLRSLPGEDISCLNLYRPQRPRILGVPNRLVQRGGFSFQVLPTDFDRDNPWLLLEEEIPGVVPAFADFNSAQWILHVGLGDEIGVKNRFGERITLRIVGLMKGSIFQSELLISEEKFTSNFPGIRGHSYFLLQTSGQSDGEISAILESNLSQYGFDITATGDLLARYREVENTYLGTFQLLGGLGLLLGTVGLGIVLWRNVVERRGELAVLRACGYNWRSLTVVLFSECAFLLAAGIACGLVAATVALAPHAAYRAGQIPWGSIGVTLAAVFATGTIAVFAATLAGLRSPLIPALRGD
jgi:putative ABC transport system permease protein